ncbi:enoyl-CoA hydratase [Nibrella saemangeumensis]|uniref:Enoyl-CoA hydratase n=1 Tax=Nibrella saemangeumensis TaxID=1084526 RepID=A0ABP8NN66_9BACT
MLYTQHQTASFHNHSFRYILAHLDDHVLTLTLNRPEKKNALNPAMLNELAFALTYAHYEKAVWMIVLGAKGDVFCAGMDLQSLSQPAEGAEAEIDCNLVPEPAGPVRLAELFASVHKPCIARVQGSVYAGGFLLVAGCNYVVAVDSASFSLPEVKRGLFPFQVMASLLDLMPARTVLDLCLRARSIPASRALQLGLVTEVAEAENLDNAVRRLVQELKQFSPKAIQFGLRAYQQLKSLAPDQRQAFLYEQFQQIQQTTDAKEGMAAFLEKRHPNWQNE